MSNPQRSFTTSAGRARTSALMATSSSSSSSSPPRPSSTPFSLLQPSSQPSAGQPAAFAASSLLRRSAQSLGASMMASPLRHGYPLPRSDPAPAPAVVESVLGLAPSSPLARMNVVLDDDNAAAATGNINLALVGMPPAAAERHRQITIEYKTLQASVAAQQAALQASHQADEHKEHDREEDHEAALHAAQLAAAEQMVLDRNAAAHEAHRAAEEMVRDQEEAAFLQRAVDEANVTAMRAAAQQEAAALALLQHRNLSGPSPSDSPPRASRGQRVAAAAKEKKLSRKMAVRLSTEFGIDPRSRRGGGGGGGGGGDDDPSDNDGDRSDSSSSGSDGYRARYAPGYHSDEEEDYQPRPLLAPPPMAMQFAPSSAISMPPSILPEYNGQLGNEALDTYFYNIERRCLQHRINMKDFAQVEHVALQAMSRTIHNWYKAELKRRERETDPRAKLNSWSKFKSAFMHTYGSIHDAEVAMKEWWDDIMTPKGQELIGDAGLVLYMIRIITFRERLPRSRINDATFIDMLINVIVRKHYYPIFKKLRGKCERYTRRTEEQPSLHWIRQHMTQITKTINIDAMDAKPANNNGGNKGAAAASSGAGDSGDGAAVKAQLAAAKGRLKALETKLAANNARHKVAALAKKGAAATSTVAALSTTPQITAAAPGAAKLSRAFPSDRIWYSQQEMYRMRELNMCWKCGGTDHLKRDCPAPKAVDLRPKLAQSSN